MLEENFKVKVVRDEYNDSLTFSGDYNSLEAKIDYNDHKMDLDWIKRGWQRPGPTLEIEVESYDYESGGSQRLDLELAHAEALYEWLGDALGRMRRGRIRSTATPQAENT